MILSNLFDKSSKKEIDDYIKKVRHYRLINSKGMTPGDFVVPKVSFMDLNTIPGGENVKEDNDDLIEFIKKNPYIEDDKKEYYLEHINIGMWFKDLQSEESHYKERLYKQLFVLTIVLMLLLIVLAECLINFKPYPKWIYFIYSIFYLIASIANFKFCYTDLKVKISYPMIGLLCCIILCLF